MTDTLFSSETPAITNATDGTAYTLGTLFTLDLAGSCVGIRWYYPTTLPSSAVKAVLWAWTADGSGTELARKTFSSPVAGAWNTATFDTPVALSPGTRYVASVWTIDRYVATTNFFASSLVNGHITGPADESSTPAHNGKIHVGGSDAAYPESSFGKGCYFVDPVMDFAATDKTLSDTGAGADAISIAATATPSDTVSATEALSSSATANPADTAAGADALSVAATAGPSDQGAGAEAISVAASNALVETATGADSIVVVDGSIVEKALTDTAAGVDSLTLLRIQAAGLVARGATPGTLTASGT